MNKVLCYALVFLLLLSILGGFSVNNTRAESTSSTPSKDAEICRTSMDMNYGADWRLDFGFDNYSNAVYRFLFQFDLPPTLSGKDITSATLKLFGPLPWSSGYPSGEAIRACRVTHDWVEGTGKYAATTQDGVTWNEYNYNDGLTTTANNWGTPGGDYTLQDSSTVTIPPYPITWYCLNITVTDIVKGWASNAYPNFGFLIKLENEAGAYKGGVFDSKESSGGSALKLEINYTGSTPTPTPTSSQTSTPTPTPTSTTTLTPTPSSTATQTPTSTPTNEATNTIPLEAVYAAAAIAIALVAAIAILLFRKRFKRPLPPPPPS